MFSVRRTKPSASLAEAHVEDQSKEQSERDSQGDVEVVEGRLVEADESCSEGDVDGKNEHSETISIAHEDNEYADLGDVEDDELTLLDKDACRFSVGDHIYSWKSMGVYQHHGIVLSVSRVVIIVVDFYPSSCIDTESCDNAYEIMNDSEKVLSNNRHVASLSTKAQEGKLRVMSLDEWRKINGRPRRVQYDASWLGRTVWRAGTCTSASSDPPELVAARVQFLLSCEHLMPKNHMLHANSENVSVWCKTGRWTTLQVYDFLHLTAAGQLKSAGTLGMYVSHQSVTVPAAGVWGYLGFTTKASLASTQPYLLPIIAGYGLVTVACPMLMLRKCRDKWNETTDFLHEEFWSRAGHEVFVECIKQWSGLTS